MFKLWCEQGISVCAQGSCMASRHLKRVLGQLVLHLKVFDMIYASVCLNSRVDSFFY